MVSLDYEDRSAGWIRINLLADTRSADRKPERVLLSLRCVEHEVEQL